MTNQRNFKTIDDLPLVLNVDDLMPVLSIGRSAVYELVRSGKIRSIRIGRNIRIPRDAVVEFLNETAA